MSKISKVVVNGIEYEIADIEARKIIKDVAWDSSSNLNNFVNAGVYNIKGTRQNAADNLPITNTGENATIAARLIVTVTPEGATTYRHSIGQTLILSNAEGKETKIYTRNGNRTSYDGGVSYTIEWSAWATQQTNINVGQVDNLDNLKDNGIYSGVWTKGSYNAYPLTFVCIVINDYFVGVSPRRISQFVYGLSKMDGSVVYQSRVWDDSENKWGAWEILNKKQISQMIGDEIRPVNDTITTITENLVAMIEGEAESRNNSDVDIKSKAVQANTVTVDAIYPSKVNLYMRSINGDVYTQPIPAATVTAAGVMSAEDKKNLDVKIPETIAKEKTALKNGDTIVGLAREVYSRQGKVDTATFQKRTTAGATSISDGVAKIKQIGGNIVKNLVDGTFAEGWVVDHGSATLVNGVVVFSSSSSDGTGRYSFIGGTNQVEIAGHVYYLSCKLKCSVAPVAEQVFVGAGNSSNVARENTVVYAAQNTDWQYLSKIFTGDASVNYRASVIGDRRTTNWGEICVKDYLLVDLTEMFGKGKEPTKDECDRMFSVLSALPKGLNFACPSALKSVGYNQWNPDNIIKNTGIVGDALEPDMPTSVAVVGCIPCKTGAGENNGYVIGYGEGDSWSDENIEVYFSPFNPLETDDELFMCRLEKDATYGTYVPKLNGYLIVVTPETAKFCVHLHWSGDREKMDYEDYVESNVALPVVPEMSEWGLAGISSDGAVNNDVIDLDRMVYIKRIGCVDLGDFNYYIEKITWLAYSNGNLVLYTPGSVGASSRGNNTFSIPELNYSYRVKCNYDAENDILTVNTASGNFTVGLVFTHDTSKDILRTRAAFTNSIAKQMCVLTDKYVTVDGDNTYYGVRNNKGVITATNTGRLQINDVALNGMDASQVKTYLKGVKAYYVLNTPEEYSIATKAAPNYIAGDYGVEEFIGGNVPFNSNILFYMRSLVNETRNFLDRLMSGFGTTDVSAIADRIVAVVNPSVINDDVIEEADIV